MKSLLAFLFLAWIWDRVLTDCHGGPETIAYYELQATQVLVTMTATCFDDRGQSYACLESRFGPSIPFRRVPDPGSGTEVSIAEDYVSHPELLPACQTPTCAVGWPWFSPVVAVDTAGHTSLEACP